MTVKDMIHVENNLIRLGCPLGLAPSNSLQIIADLEKSGKEILKSTFRIDKKGVLIIG